PAVAIATTTAPSYRGCARRLPLDRGSSDPLRELAPRPADPRPDRARRRAQHLSRLVVAEPGDRDHRQRSPIEGRESRHCPLHVEPRDPLVTLEASQHCPWAARKGPPD